MLPAFNHRVLYEFETWSDIVCEEHTLWVFKNRFLGVRAIKYHLIAVRLIIAILLL